MPQAESFADPPGVPQDGKQEAVPQMLAGIQDRLRLGHGQRPRQFPGRLQRDGAARLRLVLGQVMQERLPPAPPAGQPRCGCCIGAAA